MRGIKGTLTKHRNMWRIVVSYYDVNSVRHQKTFSTGLSITGNKRKAEKMLEEKVAEFKKSYEAELDVADSSSVSHWVEKYLKRKESEVRETTLNTYTQTYNRYIKEYFSDKKINTITIRDIDDYYSYLCDKKLGKSTITGVINLLKSAFDLALKLEVIDKNPVHYVKCRSNICHEQAKRTFSISEAKEMLDKIKDESIYPIIAVTLTYGLRRGEVLGLCWDCVDFDAKTILIKRNVVNIKNETVVKECCKTKSSVRTCTMTDEIFVLLKKVKEQQEQYKMIYKDKYIKNEYDLVFTCHNGKIRSPRGLTASYDYVLYKHGIPKSRFHDLRHTAATLMIEGGADAYQVQHALGHSRINTTLDIYVHNTDSANSKTAEIMEKILK